MTKEESPHMNEDIGIGTCLFLLAMAVVSLFPAALAFMFGVFCRYIVRAWADGYQLAGKMYKGGSE